MAARMPISAVSWSRISPTRMMSGSWRRAVRSTRAKDEVDLFVHLHLVEAGQAVFDRVFDGDDLLFRGVQLVQRGVQRGGLAGAGRAGDQHHAGRPLDGVRGSARARAAACSGWSRSSRPVFWASRRITTDSPYCVGMVEIRTSTGVLAQLDVEAAVLRQALFRDVEAGHELQAQHQRRWRSCCRPRSAHAARRRCGSGSAATFPAARCGCPRRASSAPPRTPSCSSLTTGASSAPGVRPSTVPNSTGMSPISWRQFLGQAGDFLGATVDAVEQRQQLAFGHHHQFDVAPDDARDFVVSGEVGRVGHADAQQAGLLVKHHGAETARLRLGQQVDEFRLGLEAAQIDELGACNWRASALAMPSSVT